MSANAATRGSSAFLWMLTLALVATLATGAYPAAQRDPVLGVVVEDLSAQRLDQLGIPHGVSVRAVLRWSPAETVGLRPGDILLSLDGSPLYSAERLEWLVAKQPEGRAARIGIHRPGADDGTERSIEVVLTPVTAERNVAEAAETAGPTDWPWLGIRMQPLTEALRHSYGVPEGQGVLIADIDSQSPAAGIDLRAGDVLLRIDRKAIRSPSDGFRALGFFEPGQSVELEAMRAGERRTLQATLGRADRSETMQEQDSGWPADVRGDGSRPPFGPGLEGPERSPAGASAQALAL
jgi:S1-C subfamily serine protease